MRLASPRYVTGVQPKLKEGNISTKHNMLQIPNWREADQLVIYRHGQGVELAN